MKEKVSCLECGAVMEIVRGPYRYGRGLDVVLHDVETRRCPECGHDEVVIPRIEELHRTIARAISRRPARLEPDEIRFLRTYLGYSSADFAALLGVTPETVSRWERTSKPQKMGKVAERLLRMLAQYGEPDRVYDLEAVLLTGGEARGAGPVMIAQSSGSWKVAEAG
jgi:putative zinc finger/helix-turn-helix YgiT family protein